MNEVINEPGSNRAFFNVRACLLSPCSFFFWIWDTDMCMMNCVCKALQQTARQFANEPVTATTTSSYEQQQRRYWEIIIRRDAIITTHNIHTKNVIKKMIYKIQHSYYIMASLYCCKRMTIEYRSSSRCTILRVAGLS